MKSHSSIFSSNTLDLEWKLPAGAALAISLVVAANTWAYFAEKNGILYSSIPRQMIENSISTLSQSDAIWLLGNSTLAAGFDEKLLQENIAESNAIIELGSATLETTIRLSEIALQSDGKKPKKIILFFTKDDLNQNGSRADASKSYHQAIDSPSLYEHVALAFPVYSTRYAITDKIRNGIASIGLRFTAKKVNNKPDKKTYKDLSTRIDTTYLLNLGRNYKPADIDFSTLGELAKSNNISIYLVAPPVTTAISKWQSRFAPKYTWPSIIQSITEKAARADISVLNYTNLLESTTQYFKDTYHLNNKGAIIFTKQLILDTKLKE